MQTTKWSCRCTCIYEKTNFWVGLITGESDSGDSGSLMTGLTAVYLCQTYIHI